MPESSRHERLVRELKVVRRVGLHRLGDHLEELPELVATAERTVGADYAQDVETLLRRVYTQRSEGAQGTAIGILLGLAPGRRGASPRVLREVAARTLGYYSVDTFRKQPEQNAIDTFAHLIESYDIDAANAPQPEVDKVAHVMHLIEELTIAEYGALVRQLRHRITTITDDP